MGEGAGEFEGWTCQHCLKSCGGYCECCPLQPAPIYGCRFAAPPVVACVRLHPTCRSLGDLDTLFAEASTQQQQQPDGGVQLRFSSQGAATTFTYDEQQQLHMQRGSCEWSSSHVTSSNATAAGAGGVMVQVDLPDWSYSRLPVDMASVVAGGAGGDVADMVFELGTVLTDGSLARWLLRYDAAGARLIKSATYELYPPAA